jgi:hypothetical protein
MIHRARSWGPASLLAASIAWGLIWVVPSASRNPLVETTVWASLVVVSFIGWGSLVRLAIGRQERVDLGLRAAWGAGLLCFLGGALMVPALMTRTAALVFVEIGAVLSMAALLHERHQVRSTLHRMALGARREPGLAGVGAVALAIVAVHCLGAIADWHTNPYDDDIAYLSFLKELSDTGTILEPFSFRRLSAYGGQTLFHLLVSIRAAPSQAHTFDRAVAFVMIVLLVFGHRERARRTSFLVAVGIVVMLATMPNIAINTASYWSGVAFFLAIFRTLVWLEDRDSRVPAVLRAVPLALVSVAACTLRQNYLPVPALMLAVSYVLRLRTQTGRIIERLKEPAVVGVLSVLLLVPWFIVSWQSCRTFLYPVMPGTFHRALALNATGWNSIREIAFQANVAIDGLPLEPLALFFAAAVVIRERASRRPLAAIGVGAIGGFIAVVHGLTQSDAQTIGRYAFAFMIAFVIAVALSAGTARISEKFERRHIAAGIVCFAVLAQIVVSREKLWKEYSLKFHNIELLAHTIGRVPESESPEVKLYQERLQAAVPAGKRMAVLVDEPHYLDFGRNPIWNLDMPGYASLPPGMPSFKGSEALEAYFRGLGLRWVMFVRPEYSRYHYRREYFLELFVHEQEIWRTYAPYLVDFIDSMTAIHKRHREVYAERGIVVIDLEQPPAPQPAGAR